MTRDGREILMRMTLSHASQHGLHDNEKAKNAYIVSDAVHLYTQAERFE